MISAWNPNRMHKMALPACHFHVGWNVTEEGGEKYLSCYFTMRSSDCALASCYNVVSYTILTYILAKRHGMKPKEIVYNAVDCHIYNTHVDAVKEQLSRNPRPFPYLILSDSIVSKDWEEMSSDDFELVGYFPHSSIKMEMAV
jgi:thymidylate synthase